jgi:hypothetical protein
MSNTAEQDVLRKELIGVFQVVHVTCSLRSEKEVSGGLLDGRLKQYRWAAFCDK